MNEINEMYENVTACIQNGLKSILMSCLFMYFFKALSFFYWPIGEDKRENKRKNVEKKERFFCHFKNTKKLFTHESTQ